MCITHKKPMPRLVATQSAKQCKVQITTFKSDYGKQTTKPNTTSLSLCVCVSLSVKAYRILIVQVLRLRSNKQKHVNNATLTHPLCVFARVTGLKDRRQKSGCLRLRKKRDRDRERQRETGNKRTQNQPCNSITNENTNADTPDLLHPKYQCTSQQRSTCANTHSN